MTSLTFNGCLFSQAGANEQLWHTDGEHLYSSENHFNCWKNDGNSSNDSFFNKNCEENQTEIEIIRQQTCGRRNQKGSKRTRSLVLYLSAGLSVF